MTGTVLILHPGSDPNETWVEELEASGYDVLYAEDIAQANVHVRCAHVDFVVIDSVVEDSLSVTSFVSRLAEQKNAPPIVLISSSPSAPSYSVKLGAAAFLPKPCQCGDLAHILQRMSPQAVSSPVFAQ